MRRRQADATRAPPRRLWKLPEPWTPSARPPLLGKRSERVSHSSHRPLPRKAVRSLVKRERTDHLSTTQHGDLRFRATARRPRLAAPLVGIANIVQTVPSLAMFGFLLPVPYVGGVGARAAIVVLILYGLLPIVRTTIAGLRGIDPSIREAGVAMGMTPRELLRQVELPLALPSIVAGVRVAAVVGVGSATIAAAIGAGGLGEYIYRGLSMVDTTVILAGAVPAALLALAVDGSLLWLEKQLSSRRRSRSP